MPARHRDRPGTGLLPRGAGPAVWVPCFRTSTALMRLICMQSQLIDMTLGVARAVGSLLTATSEAVGHRLVDPQMTYVVHSSQPSLVTLVLTLPTTTCAPNRVLMDKARVVAALLSDLMRTLRRRSAVVEL